MAKQKGIASAKKIYVKDSITNIDRAVLGFSEFLGTGVLVFLGCMGCIGKVVGTEYAPPHLQVCLIFGLAVLLSVQCFGHISGAHINPAVTVAAAILGHIPLLHVPIYFIGQMLGGIGGFALLKAVTPSDYITGNSSNDNYQPGVCSPAVNPRVTSLQACLVEFIITFWLVFVCAAIWDRRNTDKHDSLSIRLGLVIAVLALAGGPYSGGNMNPARSFAPALFNGDWANHWVYWVGPLAGAVAAAVLYRYVFSKENISEVNNVAESVPLNDKP